MRTNIAKPETVNGIDFYRIENDVNGNPRYVIHFLDIPLTEEEREQNVLIHYEIALKKARKIGGKKYTAKWFGGGIVFQSYSLEELSESIKNL